MKKQALFFLLPILLFWGCIDEKIENNLSLQRVFKLSYVEL